LVEELKNPETTIPVMGKFVTGGGMESAKTGVAKASKRTASRALILNI
jgi:hypothetical protein